MYTQVYLTTFGLPFCGVGLHVGRVNVSQSELSIVHVPREHFNPLTPIVAIWIQL